MNGFDWMGFADITPSGDYESIDCWLFAVEEDPCVVYKDVVFYENHKIT